MIRFVLFMLLMPLLSGCTYSFHPFGNVAEKSTDTEKTFQRVQSAFADVDKRLKALEKPMAAPR